jgi:hypothetical protein
MGRNMYLWRTVVMSILVLKRVLTHTAVCMTDFNTFKIGSKISDYWESGL